MYYVPVELIAERTHALPSVYIACMRYMNCWDEIVTSVAFIAEYLCLVPSDKKNRTNQQIRQALQTLVREGAIVKPSFKIDREHPYVNECFKAKFGDKHGARNASRLYSYSYIHNWELERIHKACNNRDPVRRMPALIHLLLYIRLKMERPGGVKSIKQIEQQSVATLTEEMVKEGANCATRFTLVRQLRVLRDLKLIDFKRRIVREKPHTRKIIMYIVTNWSTRSEEVLDKAIESLETVFSVCETVKANVIDPFENNREEDPAYDNHGPGYYMPPEEDAEEQLEEELMPEEDVMI